MEQTLGKRYLVLTDKHSEQYPAYDRTLGKTIIRNHIYYFEQYFAEKEKAYTMLKRIIKNGFYKNCRCVELDLDNNTITPMNWENNTALQVVAQVEKAFREYFDRYNIRSRVINNKITISLTDETDITMLACQILVDKVMRDNSNNWTIPVKVRYNKKDIATYTPKGE
jgi:hypothetical protein